MSEIPLWILTLSLTFSFCLFWVYKRASDRSLSHHQALDLSVVMMVGAVFGGRLLHVLYEQPQYYFENPMDIFKIWQGGFVFYGGLFGSLYLGWLWNQRYTGSFLKWADFFAPVIALGYALGRLGCFFNGCCHGRACPFPWAIDGLHPTQLYATFWELAVITFLLRFEKKPGLRIGAVFFTWILLHAIGRLIMEYFRADDRGPMPLGFSLGVWISLILIPFALYRLKKSPVSN